MHARARRGDDGDEGEEDAAICTVARRQRYFAAIVNTARGRDVIRPRGYIKISALLANIDDPYRDSALYARAFKREARI